MLCVLFACKWLEVVSTQPNKALSAKVIKHMKLFGGSIFENVRMGLDTLWQHKLRSFLTVLGVVIGTMTVIVIAAFVSGIDQRVAKEIESFGTNSIYIYRFDPGFNFNPSAEERMRKPLSYDDALAIGSECPSVAVCGGVHVAGRLLWWTIHGTRESCGIATSK